MARKTFVKWSPKQKRCYQRIMSGLDRHGRNRLRFLTLSMSPDSKKDDINKCFIILRKRIKRLTVNRLLNEEYIDSDGKVKNFLPKNKVKYFYGDGIDYDKTFPFEHLKVFTGEGAKGVLHILFFGRYIPQKWIYVNWKEIIDDNDLSLHSVDIKQCKRTIYDKKGLSRYCVNQYVAGQSEYIKFNNSANWCFRGYIGKFQEAKRTWRYGILNGWFSMSFINFWHNIEYDNFYEQLYLGEGIDRFFDGDEFVWMD